MIDYLRQSRAHIFVDELTDTLHIADEDHHHLARVMRLESGQKITAAHNGWIREYTITDINRSALEAQATREKEQVHEREIHVVASLFKLDRLEIGVAKAIEAGATSIVVGRTTRSSVTLDAAKKEKALRRLTAIARSAAMQSRRAQLIDIVFVDDLVEYVRSLAVPVVICEPGNNTPPPQAPVAVVVGPEGGFTRDELEQFTSFSRAWNLSPYIVRADTAMALAPGLIASTLQESG